MTCISIISGDVLGTKTISYGQGRMGTMLLIRDKNNKGEDEVYEVSLSDKLKEEALALVKGAYVTVTAYTRSRGYAKAGEETKYFYNFSLASFLLKTAIPPSIAIEDAKNDEDIPFL